jgi:hypothetical protein
MHNLKYGQYIGFSANCRVVRFAEGALVTATKSVVRYSSAYLAGQPSVENGYAE